MVGPCGLEPRTSTVSTYRDYEMQPLTAHRSPLRRPFYLKRR